MPRTRKDEAPIMVDEPEIEGRYAQVGEFTVSFETFRADVDPAAYFRGLPDDRCQCPHWGMVRSGRLVARWPDHEETYTAGDVYFIPPGHLPLNFAGTEIVSISPTERLRETLAAIGANLAAREPVR